LPGLGVSASPTSPDDVLVVLRPVLRERCYSYSHLPAEGTEAQGHSLCHLGKMAGMKLKSVSALSYESRQLPKKE